MAEVAANQNVLKLDFTIQPADLFRASIKVARTRIILGFAFSLAFISGLVLFFLIIDEKVILAQTSPLFVGIPLLAVGGQLLRLHASCKQYVRSLPVAQRHMSYSFPATDQSFQVASGDSFSSISWVDVMKVVEDRERFLFFFNKFDVRVIPKNAFPSADSIVPFRQLLLSRLDKRVSLCR